MIRSFWYGANMLEECQHNTLIFEDPTFDPFCRTYRPLKRKMFFDRSSRINTEFANSGFRTFMKPKELKKLSPKWDIFFSLCVTCINAYMPCGISGPWCSLIDEIPSEIQVSFSKKKSFWKVKKLILFPTSDFPPNPPWFKFSSHYQFHAMEYLDLIQDQRQKSHILGDLGSESDVRCIRRYGNRATQAYRFHIPHLKGFLGSPEIL